MQQAKVRWSRLCKDIRALLTNMCVLLRHAHIHTSKKTRVHTYMRTQGVKLSNIQAGPVLTRFVKAMQAEQFEGEGRLQV